jgi:methionine sulfoxide reductase heme-binding subunit
MTNSPALHHRVPPVHLSRIQVLVHIAAWLPALWLLWGYFTSNLTIDPTQYIERFSGRVAMIVLICSLACTPLNTIFHFHQAVKIRRPLGLYAFFYSAVHFLVYTGIDYLFDFNFLRVETLTKPYLLVGLIALIALLPLAATSFKASMRQLGKNWKRLHYLVYPAVLLVILHYSLAKKGSLLSLSGEQLEPFLFGLLVIFLLTLRIPFVSKWIIKARDFLAGLFTQPPATASKENHPKSFQQRN